MFDYTNIKLFNSISELIIEESNKKLYLDNYSIVE